jgi:hypothetical protein
MAASNSVNDVSGWLDERIATASPDLLRTMIKQFPEALMSAEADAVCGAGYRERSSERVNSRNGYRLRDWDTRAGSIELAIPKLRSGSYFPEWLLERRRRAEQGPGVGGGDQLSAGGLDAAGGEAGRPARDRAAVEEPGLGDGQEPSQLFNQPTTSIDRPPRRATAAPRYAGRLT